MPSRSLILDSGAYTVWSQNASIDIKDYLAFCVQYPGISYYVNLDSIPGVMNDKKSLTPAAISAACKLSWDNYLLMIQELPKDKVIPVFHQNDDVRWLHKYLEFGVKYIGISPANDEQTRGRLKWLKPLMKVLFDGAGRPVVKTHGFAVTSFDLIKAMEWYSVDSASWKMTPSWGSVYLPQVRNGAFVYDEQPAIIGCTPQIPKKDHQGHIDRLTPLVRDRFNRLLAEFKLHRGTHEEFEVASDYKLDTQAGEIWRHTRAERKATGKCVVMRPVIKGVTNSFEERAKLCAKFMLRANKAMRDTVKYIYLAGLPMPYPLEMQIPFRLLSWHYAGQTPGMVKYIQAHIDRLPGGPLYKGKGSRK